MSNWRDKITNMNKNQFTYNINLFTLPHKTSSQSHHFDSAPHSRHKLITPDIQIYVTLEKVAKPSVGACSFRCTPALQYSD